MRWTDYSRAAIDARMDYLKKSADRLRGMDRAMLDGQEQVNYDLYRDLLETAAKGLEFHNDAIPIKNVIPHNLMMPMNQIEGIQQDIPRTFAMMPAATREDYENIVLRLERVPPLVDQTIALSGRYNHVIEFGKALVSIYGQPVPEKRPWPGRFWFVVVVLVILLLALLIIAGILLFNIIRPQTEVPAAIQLGLLLVQQMRSG